MVIKLFGGIEFTLCGVGRSVLQVRPEAVQSLLPAVPAVETSLISQENISS